MRNLKKVLALALATVMLLGMMAMASAADFTDEALIADEYDAAVDVMQAIGVFNGSKGYLNPKSTLTRAEAAKVITYLALTKANADKLGAAEAPFADVAADNWAAGSIAYAKNLGIVSGKGENNFDPQGTLTGYELGKMLLVVLGYQAETYKGAGWDTNVNLDAMQAGLLKGLNIDLGANILREQAAQMAYNALTATCVLYAGGTVLETGDTKITVGAVKTELKDDNYASYLTTTTKDGKLQLAEKLYPTLKLNEATENDFGYATKTWYFGTPAVAVATVKNATVLATYAGTTATAATDKALYALTGETDGSADIAVYANGADAGTITVVKDGTATQLAAYKGATVEIVKEGTAIQALVSYAYPAKVTAVTAAKGDVKRSVTMTVYNGQDNDGVSGVVYTTENYAVGDWLLVYPKGTVAATQAYTAAAQFTTSPAKLLKVEAAQTVYGTLTQKTESAGVATALYLDGVSIPVANANFATYAKKGSTEYLTPADDAAALTVATKYTVVLQNGYAVAAVTDAPAAPTMDNIIYIAKIAANTTTSTAVDGAAAYREARIVKMDGTIVLGKVATDVTTPGLYKAVEASTPADGIYQTGELTAVDSYTDDKFVAYTLGSELALKATDKVVNGTFTGADPADRAYFTAESKIMFVANPTASTISTEIVAAPMATTLPAGSIVITSKNATAGVAEIAMVVVLTEKSTNAADLYYVTSADVGDIRIGTTTYDQAVVYSVATGEKFTVAAKNGANAWSTNGFTGFASYKVNADGAYVFTAEALTGKVHDFSADIDLYNGLLSIDGVAAVKDMASADTVIINTKNTTVLTAADLAAKTSVTGTAYVNDSKLVAIVVTNWTDPS